MPSLGSLLGASPLVRDRVTVLSGVVQRKDPGHQGVCLSNLSLDGGRQSSQRAQVKLETGVTPGFKGKFECIEYMCARIKLHTCIDSVNTHYQKRSLCREPNLKLTAQGRFVESTRSSSRHRKNPWYRQSVLRGNRAGSRHSHELTAQRHYGESCRRRPSA
jgi:hypothetical protein